MRVAERLDAHIKQAEAEMAKFDLGKARIKAGAVMSGSMLACGVVGQLCKALFPDPIGVIGLASVAIAGLGAYGVSQAMHKLRDPSELMGVGVLTFFTGFSMISITGSPLVLNAALTASSLAIGSLFASRLETRHNDVPSRLERMRELAQKYVTYREQHAEAEKLAARTA
jgi:hypothetical protein